MGNRPLPRFFGAIRMRYHNALISAHLNSQPFSYARSIDRTHRLHSDAVESSMRQQLKHNLDEQNVSCIHRTPGRFKVQGYKAILACWPYARSDLN